MAQQSLKVKAKKMAIYSYAPQGTCSKHISFELKDGKLHNVKFEGGCPGNLTAIGKLLEGADPQKTADLLRGNLCRGKQTSCADQLAHALDDVLSKSDSKTV